MYGLSTKRNTGFPKNKYFQNSFDDVLVILYPVIIYDCIVHTLFGINQLTNNALMHNSTVKVSSKYISNYIFKLNRLNKRNWIGKVNLK